MRKSKEVVKVEERIAAISTAEEPLFTLRAQDRLAPAVVGVWITLATLFSVRQDKIDRATKVKAAMEEWQAANAFKIPD